MTVLPHLAARLFGVPLAIHRPKLDVILSVLGALFFSGKLLVRYVQPDWIPGLTTALDLARFGDKKAKGFGAIAEFGNEAVRRDRHRDRSGRRGCAAVR